ncbi:hypothetical protein [Tunturiibacter gelidiferens]|uniref:hypothetical protein n=1 Tax=Tunturiibacter gelidiferens TaxID=3069689 RepID=UPI003D9B3B87
MATDVIEGKGTLRTTSGEAKEWAVTYRFIVHTNIIQRPGFPPAVGKSRSEGAISAVDGDAIPAGYFQLTAQDGESLRVQSHGFGLWYILSPMA